MAVFDFESGVGGAASGAAVGGPWGAVVGFFLGGFIGGKNKDKAKKAARRRERQIQYITSSENFKKLHKDVHGTVYAQALQTVAPATRSAAATQTARRGLTGTGLGSAMATNAAAAPGIAANQGASALARDIQNLQLTGIGAAPMPGLEGIGSGLSKSTQQGIGALGGLAENLIKGDKDKDKDDAGLPPPTPGQPPGSITLPGDTDEGIPPADINLPPLQQSRPETQEQRILRKNPFIINDAYI